MENLTLEETLSRNDREVTSLDLRIPDFSESVIQKFILGSTKYSRRFPIALRPYQLKFMHDIMSSTVHASSNEIVGLFSRQSGKTEAISASAYMLSSLSHLIPKFGDGIRIGIFGPKKEQSDIAFERVLNFYEDGFAQDVLGVFPMQRNATTLRLSNRSIVKSITASKNATIEGETMDLVFIEECQDVSDLRLLKSIFPMLSSTGGTRVLTGTPTPEHTGYFFYASRKHSPHVHKVPWQVAAQYSEKYHKFIQREMKKYGSRSDWFMTQYECEWLASSMKFTTHEKLSRLATGKRIVQSNEHMFIAIDPAKLQDPTVITVIDSNYNIVNWMEMIGDNYNDQLSYIEALVSQYPNSIIGVDTLGPGEVLCDVLGQRLPKHSVMRYPMDSHHKSAMFIHLKDLLDNEKMSYPSEDCPEKNRFEGQMIELDAKWNGPLLQVKAPSGSTKHDDYPASLAIAVMMVQDNSLGDAFEFSVGTKTESRKINRRVNRYMRR